MTQSLNSRDYLVLEAFIIRNWPSIGKLPIKRFQIFWKFIICAYHDHLGSKIDPKKVEIGQNLKFDMIHNGSVIKCLSFDSKISLDLQKLSRKLSLLWPTAVKNRPQKGRKCKNLIFDMSHNESVMTCLSFVYRFSKDLQSVHKISVSWPTAVKIDPKKVEKAKISYLIWVIKDWSWHAYLSFPNFLKIYNLFIKCQFHDQKEIVQS